MKKIWNFIKELFERDQYNVEQLLRIEFRREYENLKRYGVTPTKKHVETFMGCRGY